MGTVVASYGDNFTQRINAVFPDGGLNELAGYALKALGAATGNALMKPAMDFQNVVMKKLWGGMFFPGLVIVSDDSVEFKPAAIIKIPLYQGIERMVFPYADILAVERVKKGPLIKLSGLSIHTEKGEFLIMAPFDTTKILASLAPFVKLT
ncbi:hypothetical protein [uncultured Sphingomonas sp.]|uniref:hypothetical protein n=1 Tax=uncultured Sphingomonas sp. TaxID=158754 RepID=UPI00261782F3|nr:hypothetical protein [uncultured Sphingomonas sp.]